MSKEDLYNNLREFKGHSICLSHNHTKKSDGRQSPEGLVRSVEEIANETGFNILLCVTDHDDSSGIEEAETALTDHVVDIVPAVEVSTERIRPKHILVYWKPGSKPGKIPPFQGIEETERIARQQGAELVVLAHPNYVSIGKSEALEVVSKGKIDAVEVINGRSLQAGIQNWDLGEIKIGKIAGADAHKEKDILASFTLFPGKTFEDFVKAIKEGTTIPMKGIYTKLSISESLHDLTHALFTGLPRNLTKDLWGKRG